MNGRSLEILFFTQVLPYPLVGGQKIRAYYILKYLSQYHQITLVSFVRDDDKPIYCQHLASLCAQIYTIPIVRSRLKDLASVVESALTGMPIVILRDEQKDMNALVDNLIRERHFDVIHADQTSMAQYAQRARQRQEKPKAVAILDQHNALYKLVGRQARQESGLRRIVWQREAKLLSSYEREVCLQFDGVITVSDEDRNSLLSLYENRMPRLSTHRFKTIPICIDPADRLVVSHVGVSKSIIHVGTMFWPPNVEGVVWFSTKVLPRIVAAIPDVEFFVVGKRPPAEIRALENDKSVVGKQITVTGYVEDPLPLLERSGVFIVPLHAGSGMRVKILDAWLWGIPIVSTTIGVEGIKAAHGENILIADGAEEFSQAVIKLLTDHELAERLRVNGRWWVEQHYNWKAVYPSVGDFYNQFGLGH